MEEITRVLTARTARRELQDARGNVFVAVRFDGGDVWVQCVKRDLLLVLDDMGDTRVWIKHNGHEWWVWGARR